CNAYSAYVFNTTILYESTPSPGTQIPLVYGTVTEFDTWIQNATTRSDGYYANAFSALGCSVTPSTSSVRYLTTWLCAWAAVAQVGTCSENDPSTPPPPCSSVCSGIASSYLAMLKDSSRCPYTTASQISTVESFFSSQCDKYAALVQAQSGTCSMGVSADTTNCGFGSDRLSDAYFYCYSDDGKNDPCCSSLASDPSASAAAAASASSAAAKTATTASSSSSSVASSSTSASTIGSGSTNSSSNSAGAGDSGATSSSSNAPSTGSSSAGLSTATTAAVAVAAILAVALLVVAAVLFLRRRRAAGGAGRKLPDAYYLPEKSPSPRPPQPPTANAPQNAATAYFPSATGSQYYGPGPTTGPMHYTPTAYTADSSSPTPSAASAGARNPSIAKVVHVRTGSPVSASTNPAGFSAADGPYAHAYRYPPQDGAASAAAAAPIAPRRANSVAKDGSLFADPTAPPAAAAWGGAAAYRPSIAKH
ncbi:hypothetical protein HK405_015306, partial [Cladochytrium tenue]